MRKYLIRLLPGFVLGCALPQISPQIFPQFLFAKKEVGGVSADQKALMDGVEKALREGRGYTQPGRDSFQWLAERMGFTTHSVG